MTPTPSSRDADDVLARKHLLTPVQRDRASFYAAWPSSRLALRVVELEQELEDADPFSGEDANCPSCGATLNAPKPIDLGDGPFFPGEEDGA